MRSFRALFLVLGVISVSTLAYFAYILSTSTLDLPFVGQDRMRGDIFRVAVSRPSFFGLSSDSPVLDREAILSALYTEGGVWNRTLSGEGDIIVSGEYIEVSADVIEKYTTISINADVYNSHKSTQYILPHDLVLTRSDIPRDIIIHQVGLPRDMTFSVEMYGYPGLTPQDIRWYIHHDRDRSCDISAWDSRSWKILDPTTLDSDTRGLITHSRTRIEYDVNSPYTCIIAGLAGDYIPVIDNILSDFSATGSVLSVLSPEYDLQSEIVFGFSHGIFSDTGALYSSEYIHNRHLQKIEFLKSLDISPHIPLTEENIVMTPERVTLIAPFIEGVSYKISLRGISDEYGRVADVSMSFLPISEPFLSLGLPSRRTIFRTGESIDAKLYAIKAPKDIYSMKLCRISMDGYARTERMILEGKKENIDTIYSMLDGGIDTFDCTKKDINISSGVYMQQFGLADMYGQKSLSPGLYILAPREKSVALGFDRVVLPRVFSVIDTQVTMKVDASGKMQFLATDIVSGSPRGGQSIIINKNIVRTHTEIWNPSTMQYDKEYLPFANRSFASGILLGITKGDGTLSVQRDNLIDDEYSHPYGLMYEGQYEYEGQYPSFVATSTGAGHFGYVVSTWNDGITGWNFGLKESDYAWDARSLYLAYIHTDRRLYLKGEKVYIHAILRKNSDTLEVPEGENFIIKIVNPLGVELAHRVVKANDFGTISLDFDIKDDAILGSYTIQILHSEDNGYNIENGYTNFQVEVFKNPTFTADVRLKSSDIEGDILLNLRKKENVDIYAPWYTHAYQSTFYLDGLVRAQYYNGAQMRGVPFTYRIYRAPYYDSSYWENCFWGCNWQPLPEFYTEGTGSIDYDGIGVLRVPVEFSSFYDDYMYTAEVTIVDPLTGETVVTPSTLLARLPAEYKSFDPYNPLIFTPTNKIVTSGASFSGILSFAYGKWDKTLSGKYKYELVQRKYSRTLVDDLRIRDIAITQFDDIVVLSGAIRGSGLTLSTVGLQSGEYLLRLMPLTQSHEDPPDTSISETLLYISGDIVEQNAHLRVIPEKTIYNRGDIARVMIISPFTGGHIYLTKERGGVLEHEYLALTGNTLVREYIVDDTFYPNTYIGAVAYASGYIHGGRNFAVGYGEIIANLADKRGSITIQPDKKIYKNKETVNIGLTLKDQSGKPLVGEIAVMLVDESLIRLLGNIDLDIIPKFFRKIPFTTKTALTTIGMERNRFLSRRGSHGGSGDKGSVGAEIASRILFKNTAYYNPSIRTDIAGVVRISLDLPDNVTDYRIIAIGQTKDSVFAVGEDTIQVRRDYTIESHIPPIVYPDDVFESVFHIFNATKKITNAELIVRFGTGISIVESKTPLIIQSYSSTPISLQISVPQGWIGKIPYTVSLVEKGRVLDSMTREIDVLDIPILDSISRSIGVSTGADIAIPLMGSGNNIDITRSSLNLSIARGPLRDPTRSLAGLIAYPYGCVEQTLSVTVANALAIKYANTFDIDIPIQQAQENTSYGVKKVLNMQKYGGWKYWESDHSPSLQITPYVIRSLVLLRELGQSVPQSVIDDGITYMLDSLDQIYIGSSGDPNLYAEIFATLAYIQHPRSEGLINILQEQKRLGKLSRHGILMYFVGLQSLGKLQEPQVQELISIVKNQDDLSSYWYWDINADMAILAHLLIDRGDWTTAHKILEELSMGIDMDSYYVSTQAKIQFFRALIRISQSSLSTKDITLQVRSDGFLAGLSLVSDAYSQSLKIPRELAGKSITIAHKGPTIPFFYEFTQKDSPKNIYNLMPRSTFGMQVSRVFELVDESKGMDGAGNWIVTQPMQDMNFRKGQLYKVTLTVTPPHSGEGSYYLTLEDFMPGGWRPIRGLLNTEGYFARDNSYTSGGSSWSHVEARDDRILINANRGTQSTQSYTYYIRPEHRGSYLLPPVTAYYMYQPEIHAIDTYDKVIVE